MRSKDDLKDRRSRLCVVAADGNRVELSGKAGRPLLDILVENKVEISHSCGGMGSCGTCRVFLRVRSGEPPDRTELENDIAQDRGFSAEERLSCQLILPAPTGSAPIDWTIEVPFPSASESPEAE